MTPVGPMRVSPGTPARITGEKMFLSEVCSAGRCQPGAVKAHLCHNMGETVENEADREDTDTHAHVNIIGEPGSSPA